MHERIEWWNPWFDTQYPANGCFPADGGGPAVLATITGSAALTALVAGIILEHERDQTGEMRGPFRTAHEPVRDKQQRML